jgi:hypothetical protein
MPTVEGKITKVELDETTGWYGISTDNADVRKLSTKIAAKAMANKAAKSTISMVRSCVRAGFTLGSQFGCQLHFDRSEHPEVAARHCEITRDQRPHVTVVAVEDVFGYRFGADIAGAS